jgi:hypothetical protein
MLPSNNLILLESVTGRSLLLVSVMNYPVDPGIAKNGTIAGRRGVVFEPEQWNKLKQKMEQKL